MVPETKENVRVNILLMVENQSQNYQQLAEDIFQLNGTEPLEFYNVIVELIQEGFVIYDADSQMVTLGPSAQKASPRQRSSFREEEPSFLLSASSFKEEYQDSWRVFISGLGQSPEKVIGQGNVNLLIQNLRRFDLCFNPEDDTFQVRISQQDPYMHLILQQNVESKRLRYLVLYDKSYHQLDEVEKFVSDLPALDQGYEIHDLARLREFFALEKEDFPSKKSQVRSMMKESSWNKLSDKQKSDWNTINALLRSFRKISEASSALAELKSYGLEPEDLSLPSFNFPREFAYELNGKAGVFPSSVIGRGGHREKLLKETDFPFMKFTDAEMDSVLERKGWKRVSRY